MAALTAPAFAGFDFRPHRVFDSDDLDEVRALTARFFNPHRLDVLDRGGRMRAQLEHRRFGDLALNRLGWGTRVAVDPGHLDQYYLISAPTQGHARFVLNGQETGIGPACAGLVNASDRFHFDTCARFQQIVVRLERSQVEQAWTALTGRPVSRPIRFSCALPAAGRTWAALAPQLQLLARCAATDDDHPALPHLKARLTEQIATTLLLHQPHSGADTLPGDQPAAAPPSVRAAEQWMLRRLAEPQTVTLLATAMGMPVRSLQAAFHRQHGCGPMAWLRGQRLQAVHALLLQGQTTVTAAALTHGFSHLGEFARSYRQRFGETPGATRARRR